MLEMIIILMKATQQEAIQHQEVILKRIEKKVSNI